MIATTILNTSNPCLCPRRGDRQKLQPSHDNWKQLNELAQFRMTTVSNGDGDGDGDENVPQCGCDATAVRDQE